MTLVDLETAALALDLPSRAHLAERLLRSIENPSPAELEALWLEEAARRDRAIDAGEMAEISGAEVFKELKAQLR